MVIVIMKSREWYEDSIQSILCKCLPKVHPSNIRPAYLKTKLTNPFAVNRMDAHDPMKDGVKAARNTTDIIYFWWHFDPLDLLSTEVSDDVSTVIPFKLTVTCYGANSMQNAIRVKAFFRIPDVLTMMLNMQSVLNGEPRLTTFPEEINGEWWERTDVEINWNTLIDDFDDGEDAGAGSIGIGTGYTTATDGTIVVEGVSGGKD